jgi:hypothetical protein
VRVRLASTLGLAGAIAATVLTVGIGQAAATVAVYCPGGDLQGTIDGAGAGATIVVYGTCYGSFDISSKTNLTLQGGSAGATLNGRGTGRPLSIEDSTVTIRNLTLTNGVADDGGGLYVYSSELTMTNSTVKGNRAGTAGGIAIAYSNVGLTGVTITRNVAEDEGGGIDAIANPGSGYPTSVSITASTISQNKVTTDLTNEGGGGGGIRFDGADVSLTSSRVTGNIANLGGGIAAWGGGSGQSQAQPFLPVSVPVGLTLVNSSVDHNIARYGGGGGIFNISDPTDAVVTLEGTTVSFNSALNGTDGGGIKNVGTCERTATLLATGSTFQGNQAVTGSGGAASNAAATDFCQGSGPGTALMTIARSPTANGPNVVNSNQAAYGGGFANRQDIGGVASLTLQPGVTVRGNKASVTGGGVWNDCGSFSSLAQIFLNTPNNVVQLCD